MGRWGRWSGSMALPGKSASRGARDEAALLCCCALSEMPSAYGGASRHATLEAMSRSALPIVLCMLSSVSNAQQVWDWGFGQSGFALDIATDPNGYSYMVGKAYDSTGFMGFPTVGSGAYLAKVTPTGTVLWCRAFTNVHLEAVELKDDIVFAAGVGYSPLVIGNQTFTLDSTGQGYVVAAFDTAGNELWVNCAEATSGLSTGDIDANDNGELFVAASGYGMLIAATDTFDLAQGATSILVLKYAANGALEWVNSVGCGPGTKARAYGVSCDPEGNAYVTGFASLGGAVNCDSLRFGALGMPLSARFFLVQVDAGGTFQWLRYGYNATGTDVECLDNDSLVVTGSFPDSTNAVGPGVLHSDRIDMFMGSFGLDGGVGWAYRSEVASDSSFCSGVKLAKAGEGTFLLLSNATNSVDFDGLTMLADGSGLQLSGFSFGGDRLWTATMEIHPAVSNTTGIAPHGLSSDEEGRGYVCGYFSSPNGPNYFLTWSTDSIQGPTTGASNFLARTALGPDGSADELSQLCGVFPNPSEGRFHLRTSVPDLVTVVDMNGISVTPRLGPGWIELEGLPNGIYVLRLVWPQKSITERLLLLR